MTSDRPSVELVRSWLKKAEETLEEARALHQIGRDSGALNRTYYAAFYAVLAVLTHDGHPSLSKHSQVLGVFNKEYVRTGVFHRDVGRLLNRLFNERQDADYLPETRFEHEQISDRIQQVEQFVTAVRKYLEF